MTGEAQLVIVLLTGSLVSTEFIFFKEQKTLDEAFDFCLLNHQGMTQILNEETAAAMTKTPTGGYTGSAWLGLHENHSDWSWVDGTQAEYVNWASGHVTKGTELCVLMTENGTWISSVCTEKKNSICYSGVRNEIASVDLNLNWNDAVRRCEENASLLAVIRNGEMNSEVKRHLSSKETWIGLSRPALWYWLETGEALGDFHLWNPKEPVSPTKSLPPDEQGCAVVSLASGMWSREPCIHKHPFLCSKETSLEMTKILVRITIRSDANMEDPVIHDNLKQQLHSAVAKSGLSGITMSWSKLPEETQEKTTVKDEC